MRQHCNAFYPAPSDHQTAFRTPMAVRLDKWLWAARFFKTRSLAAEAIDAGRVEVNGERAKRSRGVTAGDKLRIRKPPFEQLIEVLGESEQRGPATVAATLYVESEDSRAAREKMASHLKAMGPPVFRDKGKPSKKDRRSIDRLKGR
jgi:ribosome-associated heat shock protein Hsp15